ncbi:Glutathione S-transferase [Rhodobacteraceae bacterium THAF1]|uniref:glutathione S-transferase family protein n=1 Tax=Palleronia sp. THAF1 TaxID=2587842 RepID=UPI000F41DE7E|nr:glutathione S-transferase family protein [Palleronia sp. THAF1]QFU09945.1 Glutathione S-transferase [Palleronia sp. THAF1]VDC17152.1 Glutathione S-transferase [Rhodobacteraceae bacterium THAF1]
MPDTMLHGFSGSTYVRTARIILRRKGVDYDQNPVNVLEGEPRQPEHLERHPFGKVPVLDIDGHRLRETDAIVTYLEAAYDGPSAIPESAWDKARAQEIVSLIHGYGYDALIGVTFYHIKPDFIGNPSEEQHHETLDQAKKFMKLVGEIRNGDDWLAGAHCSMADYYLGPLVFYTNMTPHGSELLEAGGLTDWWERLSKDSDFAATEPDMG